MGINHVLIYFSCLLAYGKTVPPQACFEPFNWNDCGRPPVHVLYYYKSGSRCEVGIWRGCLPNLNMFKDEYECVNTCIYVERAHPENFHDILSGGIKIDDVTEYENVNENGTEISITTMVVPSDSAKVNSSTDAVTIDGADSKTDSHIDSKTDSNTESGSIDATNSNTDSVTEVQATTNPTN